jgi:hypothetical protein
MKKDNFIIGVTILIITIIAGCNDMNNYSVSPNHQLAFSTDTVSFDTVFTTIGSTTNHFMIYNRNDEDLKINQISLASGESSNFRINVDGRKGDSFNEIPIWKKDSLYVAVEVTVDPNDENSPFVIYDSIIFITNGVTQSILLEAYGQNAHILKGGTTFEKDTTLTSERPYLIYDSIMVPEGITLNIDKGASFYMHHKAKWLIDGTLVTNGTQDEPVLFRGDRLNKYSIYISYDNIPTQWDGFFFGASSFDNKLNYTLIRNGISGLTFEESTPDKRKITISNSQIKNMDGNILYAVNCDIEASNTEFGNASNYLIMLTGGKYRFTHCTMTNYMNGNLISNSAARLIECLTLSDHITYTEKTHEFPLQQAYFDNCIIDGENLPADTINKYNWEIGFLTDSAYQNGDDLRFNYRFNHCIIKTKKVENPRFHEVLFLKVQKLSDPNAERMRYIKSDGKYDETFYDYIYDFRLANESAGIGKADRTVSEKYPVDRYGVNRLTSENGPSIGAYEYVPQEENNEHKK